MHWTDIIDGALYPDARTAVEMKEPAMKLTMVIESTQDPAFIPRLIPLLATRPLAEIIERALCGRRCCRRFWNAISGRSRSCRSAPSPKTEPLFFDVTDHDLEGYNKFVPYYLHPESIYSVGLSKSTFPGEGFGRLESLGAAGTTVNLAKICERYGGGGHARVGAISFDISQGEAAREAAGEIVAELRAKVRNGDGAGPSTQP